MDASKHDSTYTHILNPDTEFFSVPVEERLCALADALRFDGPRADVYGLPLSQAVSAPVWAEMGFSNGIQSHWHLCADDDQDWKAFSAATWPFEMQEIDGDRGMYPVPGKMLPLLKAFAAWYRSIRHFPAPAQAAEMALLARSLFLSGVRDRRGNPERRALRPWTLQKIITLTDSLRESGRDYYDLISVLRPGPQCPHELEVIVERDGMQLRNAEYHTGEIEITAVRQNAFAIAYAARQTPEMQMAAVQGNWRALELCEDQTPELVARACREDPRAMRLVREQTREVCEAAILADPHSACFIRPENRLSDLCILADDLKKGAMKGVEMAPLLRAKKESGI